MNAPIDDLMALAAARRDAAWGRTLTFSPKVFLPVTNLCRNACDYCSFRRSPGEAGAHTMSPDEIVDTLDRGRAHGCTEALFCLGDWHRVGRWGFDTMVDYLVWAGRQALERGLLPHTNAGILSRDDMARLKQVNASLGLMLETVSPRLCAAGMPHHRAPDKRPERRLRMTREAGELRIPFTSGVLVGIGETRDERIETLRAIRDLHDEHGHIQEVIVQSFRARPGVAMADAPEPGDDALADAIALARLILPNEISVQAPPNLHPDGAALLIAAGVNDFGGISPVTPDYINHLHPWPHVDALAAACAASGYRLERRLPIYDGYIERMEFVAPRVRSHAEALR